MNQVNDLELKDMLLSNSSFGPNEIKLISRRLSNDYSQLPILRDVVSTMEVQTDRSPAASVRLGVCQYLLGRYTDAIGTLEHSDGGGACSLVSGEIASGIGIV